VAASGHPGELSPQLVAMPHVVVIEVRDPLVLRELRAELASGTRAATSAGEMHLDPVTELAIERQRIVGWCVRYHAHIDLDAALLQRGPNRSWKRVAPDRRDHNGDARPSTEVGDSSRAVHRNASTRSRTVEPTSAGCADSARALLR